MEEDKYDSVQNFVMDEEGMSFNAKFCIKIFVGFMLLLSVTICCRRFEYGVTVSCRERVPAKV